VVAQNGQSIETGNADHTRQRIKTKEKQTKNEHNVRWTQLSQANTNNVNKTCAFSQTTGGK
jgi:glucose dehydrogenase